MRLSQSMISEVCSTLAFAASPLSPRFCAYAVTTGWPVCDTSVRMSYCPMVMNAR
jgi:hypothetical protein